MSALAPVQGKLENSWVRQLSPETRENLEKSRRVSGLGEKDDNRTKRPVYNGHYVLVQPTPLKQPRLVLYSPDVAAQLLHLSQDQIHSQEFLDWVSGNLVMEETWATGYALSIMGTRYTSNCPYGTGDGYGDGRAISIAEFGGFELQLKGAGKTPYARGADGRAVLRSSIREFLASEAMHYLGVRTTRALSLVVSEVDKVQRPWYSETRLQIPSIDDPRLDPYSQDDKKKLIAQLRNEKVDPNRMITESCAITCRVSPSFVRIGHIDLFARRAEKASMKNADATESRYDTSTNEWKELEQMLWHACFREYRKEAYDPFIASGDIAGAACALLDHAADRLSTMVAEWVRVGFAQGNFNADNCLVGGHTMDYGPFGWMEEYHPLFAKWTGSGQHFGFLNQPTAGYVNYNVLVESVIPLICAARKIEDPTETELQFLERAQKLFQRKFDETFSVKMGLSKDNEAGRDLWQALEPLLRVSRVDWTIFWRQLTQVAKKYDGEESTDYEGMLDILINEGDSSPFYEPLYPEHRLQYLAWIKQWRDIVKDEPGAAERMRLANPKYVLREWMLVDAYSAAEEGDDDVLKELFELIQKPYDEGTPKQESQYYRRAPEDALTLGGTAFMSCSS